VGQHGTNPGHPGKSGMGGNPSSEACSCKLLYPFTYSYDDMRWFVNVEDVESCSERSTAVPEKQISGCDGR